MRLYSIRIENDEFHKKLGGGIPAGTIALVIGEHGSGKSVICQRMVYGFLKNGVTVSYISTQLTTTDFVKQMLSLGYNIINDIIKGNLSFFPVYPLISESADRSDYSKRLMSSKVLFDKDVTIIDSLSALLKFDIDPNAAVTLMSFFKRIAGIGKAIILTALKEELAENVMEEIESASSLLIETSVKKFGTDIKNTMIIKKYNFAAQQYSKQTAFRVEPKIGLVVEIAAVA